MGLNFILPIIAGIVMTITLGVQVVPSVVENMRIKKIENRTIANQELIKNSIDRYINLVGEYPQNLEDLKNSGILLEQHKNNLFDGGYRFEINPTNGTLKIFTTIDDAKAQDYYLNSMTNSSKPERVGETNKFETFYLIEYLKPLPPKAEVGSIEDIQDRFTESDKVGKKHKPEDLVVGAKDYIVNITNDVSGEGEVEEFTYDGSKWIQSETNTLIAGSGKDTLIEATSERVTCSGVTQNNNYFVVNSDDGLGRLVWVAPAANSVKAINNKLINGTNSTGFSNWGINTGDKFVANNICTSNVTHMRDMFYTSREFNQPLNSWDTSNVTDMAFMFGSTWKFNQDISSWVTSKVRDMQYMFYDASVFDQNIGALDTSKVNYMDFMFNKASAFNHDISKWDVGNVFAWSGFSTDSPLLEAYTPKFKP